MKINYKSFLITITIMSFLSLFTLGISFKIIELVYICLIIGFIALFYVIYKLVDLEV